MAARVPGASRTTSSLRTSLLQECQLRYRGSSLDVDTAPTWAIAPFGGLISVISRAFDCRRDGSSQLRDFFNSPYVPLPQPAAPLSSTVPDCDDSETEHCFFKHSSCRTLPK